MLQHCGQIQPALDDFCRSKAGYKLITSGSCVSNGMVAINSEEECKTAAKALDIWKLRTSNASAVYTLTGELNPEPNPRPEGCYWYWQSKGTIIKDIVFSVHPHQKGRGAETSSAGMDRHPICASSGACLPRQPNSSTPEYYLRTSPVWTAAIQSFTFSPTSHLSCRFGCCSCVEYVSFCSG